jgi:hypothetical protein
MAGYTHTVLMLRTKNIVRERNQSSFLSRQQICCRLLQVTRLSVFVSVHLSIYLYLTLSESESQIREVWLKISLECSGMIQNTV